MDLNNRMSKMNLNKEYGINKDFGVKLENKPKEFKFDRSIIDSVLKTNDNKRQNNIISDLSERLRAENEQNSKLKYDINQLNQKLDREKRKLEDLDVILSEELKQSKMKEQEIV